MYKLTVAIPTYNRADYLKEMLDSILQQTYVNFIVKIYDNCSEDNTAEIVKYYLSDSRIIYQKHDSNIGGIENMNFALRDCTTDYLLIVHDDDIMLPEMIENEIEIIQSHNEIALVCTDMNQIDSSGNILNKSVCCKILMEYHNNIIIDTNHFIDYYINNKNIIGCPTVMFRMSIIKRHNFYFKTNIGLSSDTYLWIEINTIYKIYYYNKALYNYRIHEQQGSTNHFQMVPLIKIPVYNLLVHNEYPNDTILSWLNYVNNHILYLYSSVSRKTALNYYKKYKKILFLPEKNEIIFSKKMFRIIYLDNLIKFLNIIKKIIKCIIPYGFVRLYQKSRQKSSSII